MGTGAEGIEVLCQIWNCKAYVFRKIVVDLPFVVHITGAETFQFCRCSVSVSVFWQEKNLIWDFKNSITVSKVSKFEWKVKSLPKKYVASELWGFYLSVRKVHLHCAERSPKYVAGTGMERIYSPTHGHTNTRYLFWWDDLPRSKHRRLKQHWLIWQLYVAKVSLRCVRYFALAEIVTLIYTFRLPGE